MRPLPSQETPQTLVINLGTLNETGLNATLITLKHLVRTCQTVLLDTGGCSDSAFHMNGAKRILATGKVSLLKVTVQEGLALCAGKRKGAYVIDEDQMNVKSKEQLSKDLCSMFEPINPALAVIITGRANVITQGNKTLVLRSGTSMVHASTATGYMLNNMIIDYVGKGESLIRAVLKATYRMDRATQRVALQVPTKKPWMTYHDLLVSEVSTYSGELYLITDETLDFQDVLYPLTERALKNGVSMVQYRVKAKDQQTRYFEAILLRDLTRRYGATYIINDDVQLAKAVNADGVHLGMEDESVFNARCMLGDKCLVGATVRTVSQAKEAQAMGADYLSVGALNHSPTMPDAQIITIKDLKAIRRAVSLPIFGIGGIRHDNLTREIIAQLDGVAIVSAVYKSNIKEIHQIKKTMTVCQGH